METTNRYYDEGYQAYYSGQWDNPYPDDTQAARDWTRGFNSAGEDD